jgi:pimeloyl-ACP methyl ester carboxylesterase
VHWRIRSTLLISCTVAGLLALVAAKATEPAPEVIPSETYTHPNELVIVQGSRRMNLLCVGQGKQVVLFDAGAGFDLITWRHVQGQVGKFARACAFDRAGYGYSDESSAAADGRNAADDVHRLLHSALITGGVVYVGHSAGGFYAEFLQRYHPEDLVAAVLVDPAFPGWFKTNLAGLSAAQARLAAAPPDWIKEIPVCLALARQGALVAPSSAQEKACAYPAWYPEPVDEVLHREIARRFSGAKLWRAREREFASLWPTSGLLGRDDHELPALVSFGAKPLIVLTHGDWYDKDDDTPPGVQALQFAEWARAHDAIAASSKKGRHRVALGSGHFIQTQQPQFIIDAIRQVVTEVSAHSG